MLTKNQMAEIEISDITVDGLGVGRVDGMAVFVADMLPGEKGDIKIIKTAKSYAVGRSESVTEVSPEREVPVCKVFKECGGCTLQHLSYIGQLGVKHERVKSCMEKIAKCPVPVNFPLPAKQPLRYRNKTAFPVHRGENGVEIGCYKAHSHTVVDAKVCFLQSERADVCVEAVRRWMQEYDVPAYDETTGEGLVRHVVVRVTSFGDIMVALVINGTVIPHQRELVRALRLNVPEILSILLNTNRERGNVILGRETQVIFGTDRLVETIKGLDFSISLHTFLQVNHAQTELLYTQVLKFAKIFPDEVVADLYCGAGTISLLAAQLAKKVVGIEIVPEAVEDARANAQANNIENAEFLLGDCAEIFPQILEKEGRLDVIIADPPRKGMDARVIQAISDSAAKRLVYVSCDPATLARDTALLMEQGWAAQVCQPVDMFPQTTNIETVVLLSKLRSE